MWKEIEYETPVEEEPPKPMLDETTGVELIIDPDENPEDAE